MKRIIISYDLVYPGRNYDDLYEYLNSFSKVVKPLESVWAITTSKSCADIKSELLNYIDENDKLLVVNTTSRASAWFNIPDKDWIKNEDYE